MICIVLSCGIYVNNRQMYFFSIILNPNMIKMVERDDNKTTLVT